MAATPVTILVPPGEYLGLYGATGFPVGAVLLISNVGSSDVYLATAADRPDPDSMAYQIITPRGLPMKNDGGDVGEWAFSPNQTGRLLVRAF